MWARDIILSHCYFLVWCDLSCRPFSWASHLRKRWRILKNGMHLWRNKSALVHFGALPCLLTYRFKCHFHPIGVIPKTLVFWRHSHQLGTWFPWHAEWGCTYLQTVSVPCIMTILLHIDVVVHYPGRETISSSFLYQFPVLTQCLAQSTSMLQEISPAVQ